MSSRLLSEIDLMSLYSFHVCIHLCLNILFSTGVPLARTSRKRFAPLILNVNVSKCHSCMTLQLPNRLSKHHSKSDADHLQVIFVKLIDVICVLRSDVDVI